MFLSDKPRTFISLSDQGVADYQEYARNTEPPGGFYDSRIHHPVYCEIWKERGFQDIASIASLLTFSFDEKGEPRYYAKFASTVDRLALIRYATIVIEALTKETCDLISFP